MKLWLFDACTGLVPNKNGQEQKPFLKYSARCRRYFLSGFVFTHWSKKLWILEDISTKWAEQSHIWVFLKSCPVNNSCVQTIFWFQQNFMSKKFWDPQIMGPTNLLSKKAFWVPGNCWVLKHIGPNLWVPKEFQFLTNSGSKTVLVQNKFGS